MTEGTVLALIIIYMTGAILSGSLCLGLYEFFKAPAQMNETQRIVISYVATALSWVTFIIIPIVVFIAAITLSLYYFLDILSKIGEIE